MCSDFLNLPRTIFLREEKESSLFSQLPQEDKEYIEDALIYLGDELAKDGIKLEALKDEFIYGMFYGLAQVMNEKGEYDGITSMDIQLRELFKEKNKEVIGLEKNEDLVNTIISTYNALSNNAIENPKTVFEYWLNKYSDPTIHSPYLDEQFTLNQKDLPYVAERNRRWFPIILEEIENNDNFLIAVGMSHLYEEKAGLLLWFHELGYSIEIADNEGNFNSCKLPFPKDKIGSSSQSFFKPKTPMENSEPNLDVKQDEFPGKG